MPATEVIVDSSRFPAAVRQALLESIRSRQVDHQFHYQSIKQAQLWIALHEQYAPSETDDDCHARYAEAFGAARELVGTAPTVHVVGLGCGAGEKERQLLEVFRDYRGSIQYVPCDVSLPLVLEAYQQATEILAPNYCHPVVCDLRRSENLRQITGISWEPNAPRVFTFFGLMPNFEPADVAAILQAALAPDDLVLISANLAPGNDYAAGVNQVLSGYDNALTRDWLSTFLWDVGFERGDGRIEFAIEEPPGRGGLRRINANFLMERERCFQIDWEVFRFQPGERIRLFFSYRHRAETLAAWLAEHGLVVLNRWVARSEEEAVFLCRPAR